MVVEAEDQSIQLFPICRVAQAEEVRDKRVGPMINQMLGAGPVLKAREAPELLQHTQVQQELRIKVAHPTLILMAEAEEEFVSIRKVW